MLRNEVETMLSDLEAEGILRETFLVPSPDTLVENTVMFTGKVFVDGQPVSLYILLGPTFPRSLPTIWLEKGSDFEELPHVLWENVVCYHSTEGTLLDEDKPAEIIHWAIKKAIGVLKDGKDGTNLGDYADEFEVYWGYVSTGSIINLVSSVAKSQEVKVFRNNLKSYVAKSVKDVASYLHLDVDKVKQRFPIVEQATLYTLPKGTTIVPPRSTNTFWTAPELKRAVQSALDGLTVKQRRQFITLNKSTTGTMLFALPRPSGGFSLFGVSYESSDGYHPFSERGKQTKLHPLNVSREEAAYILPRGGGKTDLKAKNVLLIGSGSVGGYVAHELIRAGIMQLTVVDFDKMSLDNTFRHVLGNAYPGRPKATAIREELQRKFPYVHIVAVNAAIESAVQTGTIRFEDYDLVISSLGSPTTEIWINQRTKGKVPGIFGWVEPLGIGGHALLACLTTPGCFKCLYSSEDPEDYLINRAAFAGKNQWFGKSLSGCGQLHTPYGSLDALRTATITVQLALDYLTGKEQQSSLVSWKGNDSDFLQNGYKLSNRFYASEENLSASRYAFATPICSICGNSANLL